MTTSPTSLFYIFYDPMQDGNFGGKNVLLPKNVTGLLKPELSIMTIPQLYVTELKGTKLSWTQTRELSDRKFCVFVCPKLRSGCEDHGGERMEKPGRRMSASFYCLFLM